MYGMKHYLVRCKHGHVGRNKYLPLIIPVMAHNSREAALKARLRKGVKRNHKDWCLEIPKEVSKADYDCALQIYWSDPYWENKTRRNLSEFSDRLVDEPNYSSKNGLKTNTAKALKKSKDCEKWFIEKKMKSILLAQDSQFDYFGLID